MLYKAIISVDDMEEPDMDGYLRNEMCWLMESGIHLGGFERTSSADINDPSDALEVIRKFCREHIYRYPVGKIDYYGFNGSIRESLYFYEEKEFIAAVKESCGCGEPMGLTVYSCGETPAISTAFIADLDTPPLRLDQRQLPDCRKTCSQMGCIFAGRQMCPGHYSES